MSWSMVAGAAISVVGGVITSNKSKDQAKVQADAILDAGQIDTEARNKAISQVLEIFGPSLVDFNESMQGSIDLTEQGRISTGDLLTQSANNVSQIVQQGGQSALNAMLGLPAPVQPATQQPQLAPPKDTGLPVNDYQRDITPSSYQPDAVSSKSGGMPQPQTMQANLATSIPDMPIRDNYMPAETGGGIGGASQFPTANNANNQAAEQTYIDNTAGFSSVGDKPYPSYQQYADMYGPAPEPDPSAYTAAPPLEGEFLPRDYNFTQQGITMPAGTNAGLLGAEQAVQSGADAGQYNLAQGAAGAIQSLGQGTATARNDISSGAGFAINKIQQGLKVGQQGIDDGVSSINRGVSQATSYLNPYMSAGAEALDPYLALSGVRGQEALDNALINDPAYNLALKESEQALSRNAAVTGGIGSGNTMGRFQLNAQEQAAADIDRQLSRFRAITDAGQAAAGTAGGFATQGGIAAGNLQAQGGQLAASQYNNMANVGVNSSQQLAQLAQQLGMSEADVLQQLGGNLANIDVGTGNTIGDLRNTAGINASQLIQNTSNQQSGIDAGLAQQLASLDQDTLNNVINSLQTGAGTNLSTQQQLATILANMGVSAGTSAANTAINLGQANASGVTNPIGNAINTGIGLYASGAFDNNSNANPYQPTTTAGQTIDNYNAGIGY